MREVLKLTIFLKLFLLFILLIPRASLATTFGVKALTLEKNATQNTFVGFEVLIWSSEYPFNLTIEYGNMDECIIPQIYGLKEIENPTTTIISGGRVLNASKIFLSFYLTEGCKKGTYEVPTKIVFRSGCGEIRIYQERDLNFRIIVDNSQSGLFSRIEKIDRRIIIFSVLAIVSAISLLIYFV